MKKLVVVGVMLSGLAVQVPAQSVWSDNAPVQTVTTDQSVWGDLVYFIQLIFNS